MQVRRECVTETITLAICAYTPDSKKPIFPFLYFILYRAGEMPDHYTMDNLAVTLCAYRTRHSPLVSGSIVPPPGSLHAAAGGIVITPPVVGAFWPEGELDSTNCERSAI